MLGASPFSEIVSGVDRRNILATVELIMCGFCVRVVAYVKFWGELFVDGCACLVVALTRRTVNMARSY